MRLVTWNLDGLNDAALDERSEAAVFTAVLGAPLEALQSGKRTPHETPDVLLFQEVVPHSFTAHFRRHLSAGGYTVFPETPPERQTFEIIAAHAPWRLESVRSVPLMSSRFGRVLHIAELKHVDGSSARVLTGHCDSGTDGAAVRTAQLRQIADELGTHGVFGGDVNLRKAEWEASRKEVAMIDAWEQLGEPAPTKITWQRDEYKARFDRVFLGPAIRAQSMDPLGRKPLPSGTRISDHVGLVVNLDLNRSSPPIG